MLLAYDRQGDLVHFTPQNRDRFEAYRAACQTANPAFFTMLRAEDLTLATDRLTFFAHWIAPEEQLLRFDTRFFAAVAPPPVPVVDGHEIVALRWLTPPEAMDAFRAERHHAAPAHHQEPWSSACRVAARGRTRSWARYVASAVPTIRPRVLQVDGKPVPVLPGDPRWY